jgi:hypothetical protein
MMITAAQLTREIDALITKRTLAPASQRAKLMTKIRGLRAERDLLIARR